jgi:predicted dehydrogenase
MIKAGMVGAGYIAESHARGYAALPQARLVLVVDRNLEKARNLADQYQAQAAGDVEALFSSDVEVVSICTPTPSHAQLAIALMRAGKHVLCEKPLARTLEEAQSMIDCAEQTGVKLMVGHVSRYEADHLKARDLLESGAIGELRMGYHGIIGPYPGWSTGNWLGDTSYSGGPVVDLAVHSVDYLMWLFKKPVLRVYALGSRKITGHDHYVLLNLQFEGGGLGLVEASWAHPASAPLSCRVELCADKGRIVWDYSQTSSTGTCFEGKTPQEYVMEGENSFAAEIGDFLHCIEYDLPVPIPASAGREALRVCLAALKSLESGCCVELPRS